jgi:hypothetical protein
MAIQRTSAYKDSAGNFHTTYSEALTSEFKIECQGILNKYCRDNGIQNATFTTSQVAGLLSNISGDMRKARTAFDTKMNRLKGKQKAKGE